MGPMVLLPITIDRLMAVCYPFRHRSLMTPLRCRALCISAWIALPLNLAIDTYNELNGSVNVSRVGTNRTEPLMSQHEIVSDSVRLLVPSVSDKRRLHRLPPG